MATPQRWIFSSGPRNRSEGGGGPRHPAPPRRRATRAVVMVLGSFTGLALVGHPGDWVHSQAPAPGTVTEPVSPPHASIAEHRQGFERDALSLALAELEGYLENLIRLETRASADRDYRTAITVRNERERVEGEIRDVLARLAPRLTNAPIIVDADNLRESEGILIDDSQAIGGWASDANFVEFAVPTIPIIGAYEVVVEYTLAGSDPLEVTLRDQALGLSGALPVGGTDAEPLRHPLGHLRLKPPAARLRFEVDSSPDAAPFRLIRIHLTPPIETSESPQ